jgi:hypothetical protein
MDTPPEKIKVVVGSRQSFISYCRDVLGMDEREAEKNRMAIHFRDWRDLRGHHRPGELVFCHDADPKAAAAAEREIGWMNAEWPEMRGFK